MTVGRVLRCLRVEVGLAGVAYAGLLVFAHPRWVAALLDLPAVPWAGRLFDAGLVVALATLGCLAVRLTGRLHAHLRRAVVPGEGRAVSGTVMAEFALVLPIVLLVMSMIAQLALIANASLVVRYAAFAAARSAIVSFEADMPGAFLNNPLTLVQFPPFPEWVDGTRPQRAAELALTAISPATSRPGPPHARAMERLLQSQGGVWAGRRYADRYAYAAAATRVSTIRDNHGIFAGWHRSYSQLVPRSEHLIPPYALSQGETDFYIPVPPPPQIPGAMAIPLPPLNINIGPVSIPVPLPITHINVPLPGFIINPINNGIRAAYQRLRSGSATVIDAFAGSPLNIDPFAPKRVEITVEHDFLLTLPSLHFIPGMNLQDAPVGSGGKTFTLRHTVWLQSTGGRRANMTAFLPMPSALRRGAFRENSPLYWVWP